MAGNGSVARRSVTSKVVAILQTFRFGGSLTITQIAQTSGLPLSTTHRLVGELAGGQLLRRGDDGRYELIQTVMAHNCTRCPPGMIESAGPAVDDLSSATRSDVRLGLLDGLRVSYAEKVYGLQPLSGFSPAATLPTHATAVGQVLLAFSAPELVRHVVDLGLRRYTPCTMTSAARLDHALRMIRLRGVAVVSGELRRDHSAVAAPIFDAGGGIVAALEVRLGDVPAELRTVVPALAFAARSIARALGRADPISPGEEVG